ncbi:transcription factor grauzone-like [Stomoxys calcitrans]|uniref:transcription factor grauzone-like n=1 Tax=Stomoxys calcitrans TaxID=35570 RepID=UPI0027E37732|nr:transcription factor grauzone-like [Stomoxys calcitrans]
MPGCHACRLCRSSCIDSLRLYNASGSCNEIYNITKKFFHIKYLDHGPKDSTAVLCMECWRNISDFNSFQQTVTILHDNLVNDEVQTVNEPNISRVQEPADGIEIPDALDEFMEETDRLEVPSTAGFGSGQLIVTDSGIQFLSQTAPATDIIPVVSGGLQYVENAEAQVQQAIVIDDEPSGSDEDVFVVNELDQWEHQSVNSISSTEDSNDQLTVLRKRSRTSENPSPALTSQYSKSMAEGNAILAEWRPFLDCYVCRKKFPDFAAIKQHFKMEHYSNDFFIECCGRKIKYRFRLVEHALIHVNPKAFQCQYCQKCLANKNSLLSHKHFLHFDQLTDDEKKQISSVHISICPVCGKSFTYRTGLHAHMRSIHFEEYYKRKASTSITNVP